MNKYYKGGNEKNILPARLLLLCFKYTFFFTHSGNKRRRKIQNETHRKVPSSMKKKESSRQRERKISNILAQLYFFFVYSLPFAMCIYYQNTHTHKCLIQSRTGCFPCAVIFHICKCMCVSSKKYSRAKDLKYFTSVVLTFSKFDTRLLNFSNTLIFEINKNSPYRIP